MKPLHIILIVVGAILILFVLFVVMVRLSSKKRYNRLQENLKKLQQEKEDFENDNRLSLEDNLEISDVFETQSSQQKDDKADASPMIEDYVPEVKNEEVSENKVEEKREEVSISSQEENLERKAEIERMRRQQRDAEFENFMNEHAFSRKVLDKNLLNKLKNLPPEMKNIILNSVFDKFDDDKTDK